MPLAATLLEICQDIGVSEKTYYRWKSLYGGMTGVPQLIAR